MLSEELTKHFRPQGWHFVRQNNLFANEGKTAGRIQQKKLFTFLLKKNSDTVTETGEAVSASSHPCYSTNCIPPNDLIISMSG